MTRHDDTMCPERDGRRYCTQPLNHEGQCSYRISGGQGGTVIRWWGANPRPAEWIDDFTYANLRQEVIRLRNLCEDCGIDWRADITPPGDHMFDNLIPASRDFDAPAEDDARLDAILEAGL
jgi:hypothetical protein